MMSGHSAASRAFSPGSFDQPAGDTGTPGAATGPSCEERPSAIPTVLLVEDNAGDVLLLREAMHEHGLVCHLVVIEDGEQAIEYIARTEELDTVQPALIILDLNLPRRSGREILARLRSVPFWAATPIVILSSSEAPDDLHYAAANGASLYIRKPLDLEEFMAIGAVIRRLLERQKDASA
jgi:CheY-like chemotaxis protein